jgi:hypothetical protein
MLFLLSFGTSLSKSNLSKLLAYSWSSTALLIWGWGCGSGGGIGLLIVGFFLILGGSSCLASFFGGFVAVWSFVGDYGFSTSFSFSFSFSFFPGELILALPSLFSQILCTLPKF